MKTLKSTAIYFTLIIILTIPLCLGFMNNHLINGHDSMAGLIRALSMEKYMGHGQFLVRWSPEINFGYGYPMFNFYPPFFSFVSVIIFQLTHNMIWAINWSCFLFWALSGIGMFLLAREYWGNEGGMFSALLYMYAPYHIIDLYVRGAFAEFSSFAFFPFLLFSILKLSRKLSLGSFILGVCSVFGLSLAHNIMSMLFFPVAAAYMLYLYFLENKSSWIIPAVAIFIVGLMMSSFFWLPALMEKQFLNLNFLISMRYDFHKSFITLSELFWPFNNDIFDNISFKAGIIQSLLCLGTLAFLSNIFKINKSSGRGYLFFLGIGLMAVFFSMSYSHLFWEHINILRFIQFPWRFLAIIVFAMSFLCGSMVLLIKNPVLKIVVLTLLSCLTIFLSLKSSPQINFVDHEKNINDFIAMGEGEYTPKWVMVPPGNNPPRKFEMIQGKARLADEIMITPVQYDTKIQALEPSLICFHTFYFPGWRVFIDGQSIQPYTNNPFGMILFSVSPGIHNIEVIFGSTPIRLIALFISWVGVILLLGGFWWIKSYLKH